MPGDSLVFTAGFLASQGFLNIYLLCVVLFVGAVLGDNVGYWFGKKTGPMIFKKEDSRFFKKEYVTKAHDFFDKHGGKSLILARFVPVVRTFTPIVAGVGRMNYSLFFFYNIIGGLFWSVGITLLGFFLGRLVPNAERYIFPIVILIIFVSILPSVIQFFKLRKNS
ncbi:MAG: VTT domain-containing protein [Candidatus Vogelbacteria bacterium]|nr:VTT domain-containing protein [Candidatus Vogelbacteria bacterium]